MSSSSSSQRPALIRLARYDTPDDQFVLLHATPTSAVHPLNLKLHATEGERAFATDITQSKIYELRARSYTGTSEDLEKIFLALLLKQDVGVERGVELAAAVDAKGVTLTVRQDIGGIKQRIAALQIPEEEVEIPIFEWAVEACGDLNSGSTQLGGLQSKVESQKKEIEALTMQLKDLAAFKKEHEETLLAKFSELLNSKKAKIRELSRELEVRGGGAASSMAESPIAEDEPEVADPAPTRGRGGRGRGRGRAKAAAPPRKRKPIAPPTDSESEGFVKMEVDNKGRQSPDDETEDSEEGAGPSRGYLRQDARSDQSITEDEDELPPVRRPIAFTIKKPDPEPEKTPDGDVEMDEQPPAQPARTRGRARGGGGKGKAPASPPASRGKGRVTRSKPKEPSPSPPPPSPPANDDDETGDSEDDEL